MTTVNTEALTTARRYRVAREIAGFKQAELASLIGVSRSALVDWEQGRTEPAFSKLVALARATKQPLDWFAEGLDLGDVRPKGLEPLTFWTGVDEPFWDDDRAASLADLGRQLDLDMQIALLKGLE